MLDLEAIRRRITSRFAELGWAITGNWDEGRPISRSTVRHFLSGATNAITLDTAIKLAGVLGTTEEWILFGSPADRLSEDDVLEMVGVAFEELQPGMTLGEIRPAVASALHGQIKLRLAGGEVRSIEDARSARATGAQSPAATSQDAQEESHTA